MIRFKVIRTKSWENVWYSVWNSKTEKWTAQANRKECLWTKLYIFPHQCGWNIVSDGESKNQPFIRYRISALWLFSVRSYWNSFICSNHKLSTYAKWSFLTGGWSLYRKLPGNTFVNQTYFFLIEISHMRL